MSLNKFTQIRKSFGKRSQSALEYMMTYGWAIAIIVIVAAVLYTFGVFTPSSSAQQNTITGFGNGVKVVSVSANASDMEFFILNEYGYAINLTQVSVLSGSSVSSSFTCINTFLQASQSSKCIVKGLSLQNPTTAKVTITFSVTQGSFTQVISSQGTVSLQLTSISIPSTTFTESGLPTGTNWSVSYIGSKAYSTSSSISFTSFSGTYSFAVASFSSISAGCTAEYNPSPTSGSLIAGSSEAIVFTAVAPSCVTTFTESGLTSGAQWTVVYGGSSNTSTSTSLTITTGSGNFSFSASASSSPSPSSGCAAQNALLPTSGYLTAGLSKSETFTSTTLCTTTFVESGLPTGTKWTAVFNGSSNSSTTTTIKVTTFSGSADFTPSQPANSSNTMTSIYTSNDTSGVPVAAGSSVSTVYYPALYSKNIYVSSFTQQGVQAINGTSGSIYFTTGIASGWPYSKFPGGVSISPDGNYLYVITQNSATSRSQCENGLFTISASTGTILGFACTRAIINSESALYPFTAPPAMTPNGEYAIIPEYSNNSVSMVNVSYHNSTMWVHSLLGFAGPVYAVTSLNGQYAYITNFGSDYVSVISMSTFSRIKNITTGSSPEAIAINPNGKFAYVTEDGSHEIAVINLTSNTDIANISIGMTSGPIAVTPDGKFAYVGGQSLYIIAVINLSSNSDMTNISVPSPSRMLAITPNGKYVYSTDSNVNTAVAISTASNSVSATITIGNNPDGLAITPDSKYVYIANYGNASLSVINTSSNVVFKTMFGMGITPRVLTATNAGAYVASFYNSYISYISANTFSATDAMSVGTSNNLNNYASMYNPSNNMVSLPNNKFLYLLSNPMSAIYAYNLTTNKFLYAMDTPGNPAWVSTSVDSKYMYSISSNFGGPFYIDNSTSGAFVKAISGFNTPSSIAVANSSKYILLSSPGGLFLINGSTTLPTYKGELPIIGEDSLLSPDHKVLYTFSGYGFGTYQALSVINVSSGQQLSYFNLANLSSPSYYNTPAYPSLSSDGKELCIPETTSNALTLINTSNFNSLRLIASIALSESNPVSCVFTPNNKYVLVSDVGSNFMTVINLSGGSITTKTLPLGVGGEGGVAVSPVGNYAFVEGYGDHNLTVINTTTMQEIKNISTGQSWNLGYLPQQIIVSPNGRYVYVAAFSNPYITEFNVSSLSYVTNIYTGAGNNVPAMIMSNNGKYIYASDNNYYFQGTREDLAAINISNGAFTILGRTYTTVINGYPSVALSESNDSKYLYADYQSSANGSISIINVSSVIPTTVKNLVDAGNFSQMANAVWKTAYVTGYSGNVLDTINTTGATLSSFYGIGINPKNVIFSNNNKYAYVVSGSGGFNTLAIVNMTKLVNNLSVPFSAIIKGIPIGGIGNPVETLTPDGRYLIISAGKYVLIMDTATDSIVKNISASGLFLNYQMYATNKFAYLAPSSGSVIPVVNLTSLSIYKNITDNGGPYYLAMSPDNNLLYAVNSASNNTLLIINTTTNEVVGNVYGYFSPNQVSNLVHI
ncbi:MAG: hypothetical protein M1348_01235 [Candidatus Parvarchaeota archaeon]|nr:hypothetical protein [Candidatus Parvarchaeota archaeon]